MSIGLDPADSPSCSPIAPMAHCDLHRLALPHLRRHLAQTATDLNPFTWNPATAGPGTYRGYVIVENGAGQSNPTQSPVVTIDAVGALDRLRVPTTVSRQTDAQLVDSCRGVRAHGQLVPRPRR